MKDILVHLVGGTHDAAGELAVSGFGELFVDQIQSGHIDRWKEQVTPFLATLREAFPQHYAMALLGFATGLRPSSLRPLRRKGDEVDVLLDGGKLRVRQSQTLGETVLNTTKQKTRYTIELPAPAIEVIRWHIRTQLVCSRLASTQ